MGQYNGLCFTSPQTVASRFDEPIEIQSDVILLAPTMANLDITGVSIAGLQEVAAATITFKNVSAFTTRFLNSGGITTPSGTPYVMAPNAIARALLLVTESDGTYTASMQIIP